MKIKLVCISTCIIITTFLFLLVKSFIHTENTKDCNAYMLSGDGIVCEVSEDKDIIGVNVCNEDKTYELIYKDGSRYFSRYNVGDKVTFLYSPHNKEENNIQIYCSYKVK